MIDLIHHDIFADALEKIARTMEAARDGSSVSCVVTHGKTLATGIFFRE